MLSWFAHGISYGIGRDVLDHLRAGRHVIVNLSRGLIPEARQQIEPVHVIHVTCPKEVLRTRLQARGREAPDDIERRLARIVGPDLKGEDVTELINDGSIEEGIEKMLHCLRQTT